MPFTSRILAFDPTKIGTLIGRSTFISRMHPADTLLYFIVAAFVTNILTLVMILGLPASSRPIPSSDTTPELSGLSLDSERANSEIQDSAPSTQIDNKPTEDDLAVRNSDSCTNHNRPILSPGGKFSIATIVLTCIVFSVLVKFACIQKWQQCYLVPIAWWDIYETILWIALVFELGISSLALGRWLMLLCDLWGETGRKFWFIREYFLFMVVVIAVVVPFMLLWMCFQAFRKWYRSRSKVNTDDFAASSTCDPGTAIAEPNAGCANADDPIPTYKPPNALRPDTGFKRREKRWPNSSSVANKPSAADTTSLADFREQSDRLVASTHALARQHGMISNYQGQMYKWHQVAEGAWRGIAPEDWDDNVHIKNDTVIKYSETDPMDFSMSSPNTALSLHDPGGLVERNFPFATCGFLRTCVLGVIDATAYSGSVVGNAFIKKVSSLGSLVARVSAADLWAFLNQPVITSITVGLAGGIISGIVRGVTSARLQTSGCLKSGIDADTLSSTLAAFPADKAGQATVVFKGITGTFSFKAVPTD
jgi:hypothetical protein